MLDAHRKVGDETQPVQIESLRIDEVTIDSDFYKIIQSRRPSPNYEWGRGCILITGFRVQKKEFVPAVERREDILALAILLLREGWPVKLMCDGVPCAIKPPFSEEHIKPTRTGIRNERTILKDIPRVRRPYGPQDFIRVPARFSSVCAGCGGVIQGPEEAGGEEGEVILWAKMYRSNEFPKGEAFHLSCEPGPIEGRTERWERAAQEFAARVAAEV